MPEGRMLGLSKHRCVGHPPLALQRAQGDPYLINGAVAIADLLPENDHLQDPGW
jgi:hypothetical protein